MNRLSLQIVPKGQINNIPALVQMQQAIIWTNGGQFTDAYMRHPALITGLFCVLSFGPDPIIQDD